MLKLNHLFPNFDLAKEALKHWEHDPDTLDADLSRFRISSNAIYPFRQGGRLCFLRLAPKEEKLAGNLAGEYEFLRYLNHHHYPALEPIPTRSGEEYLLLDTPWGAYYAGAFYGVAGIQLGDTELSKEVLYQYGKTLGRLHALAADFTPAAKKWSHSEVLAWVEDVLREYAAPVAVHTELQAVRSLLANLPLNPRNYGLVHYDFEPDNVFYDAAAGCCRVIDFDDSMYHWYALDIEQVFDALGDCFTGEELEAAKALFMDGYRFEHPFTQEAEKLLPLMRRFINLYTYARLTRSVAGGFADGPEWLLKLQAKLKSVIIRLENTMESPEIPDMHL